MKVSYNWLKWYVPDAPEAQKLADLLTYHLAEVETIEKLADGDYVLDIKILPNRAHDLLSHLGMAREISALLQIPFNDPTPKYKVPESKHTNLKIEIQTENCRRYMGRVVKGVKVGPSPDWVVKHLESIGQRSINNIVDATNIVMWDCGQPTHIFDLDKIKEKIIVRQAKEGEELTTLDNKECKLKPSAMVIADSICSLAVAGVKGGKAAEVDENTKNIILETANFEPTSVRKTAQALNVFTDAKKRFENDLSPELAPYALRELSALIYEMCPEAVFEDAVDVYPKKQEERKLSFKTDRIGSILGTTVSVEQIKEILERYNFKYTENNEEFEINVPPMRLDLVIEEDMAEEIGRIIGYDKLNPQIPKINFKPKVNELYAKIVWARNKLINEGYSEVMNSSFRNSGEVAVLASASDKNFLRTNLTDGLKESIKLNQSNAPFLGISEVKVFEIGTVFSKNVEEMRVAYGNKKVTREVSLAEFAKDAEIELLSSGPRKKSPDHSENNSISAFSMWSLFPFIARDVAVWVPEGVTSEEVMKVIKEEKGEMVVRGPELFDEFKKEGKTSYAFRLVFQSYERTLTDEEVNQIMTNITNKIKDKSGWQVR